MILPPRAHRCHDRQCLVRADCERWRQRETGVRGVQHLFTLRQGWESWDQYCRAAIPADTDSAERCE